MRRGGVWGRGQSDACDRRPASTDPVPGTEQMVPGTGWRDGAVIWCQAHGGRRHTVGAASGNRHGCQALRARSASEK